MAQKRILIVDDEKECCELLKDYFKKNEYQVDIVSDGIEAKKLVETNEYEYIIFDYSMPCFSGADLVKVIIEKNPKAKKILISGYDLLNDDTVKTMKVDAFLRKPFFLEDLGAVIDEG